MPHPGSAASAWDDQPASGPDPGEEKGNRVGRRRGRLGDAGVVERGGEGFGSALSGLDIRNRELSDRHPLEVVPTLSGLDQEDLALGVKNREGEAREAGSRAQVHEGAGLGRDGRIEGGRIENEAPDHRLGAAMACQVDALSPSFDEDRELRQGCDRGFPLLGKTRKRLKALGKEPDQLDLGGIRI